MITTMLRRRNAALTVAIGLAAVALASATLARAHPTHPHARAATSCGEYAGHDRYHPEAPRSYSIWYCSGSSFNNAVWVHGLGRYSGTWHHTVVQKVYIGSGLYIFDSIRHYHS